MTGQVGRVKVIDGKYEVLRELSTQGMVTLSEVRAAEGVTRHVAWFAVATPADRQVFHAYRTALRALEPAGLTDVVARPGAYYAVWKPVAGQPLAALLEQKVRPQETVDALNATADTLAAQGYALDDADLVTENHQVSVAYLRPLTLPRTPEDIAARNAQTLAPLKAGRVRRRREPGAWLSFVPGLLLLGGAAYLGAQAVQIYLNPPVREVVSVTGQEAKVAARSLTGAGFRVEYTQGQAGGRAIGSIIRQDPAGGTTLPRGRLVILTVNNPPAIEVPALEEMNVGQARDALKDRAMLVGKVIKIDGTLSNTPEGRVIAQLPEAGSSAQRGQSVQLLISTGISAKETWLPNLTGLTFDQARAHARAAGLVVTSVERQPSDQPENTVLEQTPAPYVRVDVGSPVKLTVASARYSAPSRPAGNLPLPPAYVPPTPVQPEAPQGTEPTTEPVTPDAVPATPDTGSTGTGTTTPPAPETAQPTTPATPEIAPTEPQSRSVNFEYVFPGDLPAGNYTVVVRDDDGERQIMPPTAAANLANRRANSSEAAVVRGNAVFVIRRDGVDYATVTP
ncbi:PASTA domain-containing protein [Deinococcus aquaticus]|uniref:PASTA domain-containing protein n=1 Tax=Deinococcus aquaticus TaxID=328692 RepID=A0ABY7V0I9_9DEIO|nr:PASTA domain-containing protein [Deinococcus aquaticus]WDA58650.1 PASTA domain-containing protein [Deinococcus aquaticus]